MKRRRGPAKSKATVHDTGSESEGESAPKKKRGRGGLRQKAASKTETAIDAEAAAYATAIMEAKEDAKIGYATVILHPRPARAKQQPVMLTKQFNPREAPMEEVVEFIHQCHSTGGRLDRLNFKYALAVLADPEDIANLDEIKEWAPGSSSPLVDVVWKITNADGKVTTMTLANGNHRKEAARKLLQSQFEELARLEMWVIDFFTKDHPTPVEMAHKEKCERDITACWNILEKESTFGVELYDRREHFIPSL